MTSDLNRSPVPEALATFFVTGLACLAIYGALVWAPNERTMGFLQRIFYFHAASGWVAMTAFFIVFLGNVGFLVTRNPKWDWLALAGVEVGLIFISIVLVTGPIWAKPAWGIWWDWDARLTSTFVLWILYISYLLLRRLVDDPERRAVISAVFGAFAFLDVPLVYFSIWWWRTQHPPPLIGRGGLAPDMLKVFFFCCIALSGVMALMIRQRYKLEALRHEVEELKFEAEHHDSGGAV